MRIDSILGLSLITFSSSEAFLIPKNNIFKNIKLLNNNEEATKTDFIKDMVHKFQKFSSQKAELCFEETSQIYLFGVVAAKGLLKGDLADLEYDAPTASLLMKITNPPYNILTSVPIVSFALSAHLHENTTPKLWPEEKLPEEVIESGENLGSNKFLDSIAKNFKLLLLYPLTGAIYGCGSLILAASAPIISSGLAQKLGFDVLDSVKADCANTKEFLASTFVSTAALILLPLYYLVYSTEGLINPKFKGQLENSIKNEINFDSSELLDRDYEFGNALNLTEIGTTNIDFSEFDGATSLIGDTGAIIP
ncbi:MAG: hypothetical protein SFT68_00035 [Rickettsiaceae bacterium]|nr:hypothetical protein [Rickettsiaceae bacterium]